MSRPSWHQYFMDIAEVTSNRSTCLRRKVGCVLVQDRRIVSTGFNGSMRGAKHCTDVGCLTPAGVCVRTIHAEINAVCQAAKGGVQIEGAVCYVTCKPCFGCLKTLANSGIGHVYYRDDYHTEYPEACEAVVLEQLGVAK